MLRRVFTMAQFLKHIGKHGDRKVAVIFRQLPNEEHMALVVYTQLLNQNIHDPLIACIESSIGQQSRELAEALNRTHTKDGKIILQTLHAEGMLKKINTDQIVMTPTPGATIRLNELNKLLNEMEQGEEAVKKMAEIDASQGLQDPRDIARRVRESERSKSANPITSKENVGALDNTDLAANLRQQASRMELEARGLLAESQRLQKEAAALDGTVSVEVPVVKSQRGRKKSTVAQG